MEKIPQAHAESKENLELSFRKATSEDADAFVELEHTAAVSKTYSGILDKEEAIQEFIENEVFLIYKDEKLAGSTEYQMQGPNQAYLSGLVVHPDYQGLGIAREAALFRLEKLKDVKKIYLVTHPQNIKIISLYESLGFRREGEEIKDYYGDGEPRITLVREKP